MIAAARLMAECLAVKDDINNGRQARLAAYRSVQRLSGTEQKGPPRQVPLYDVLRPECRQRFDVQG